MTRFWDNVRRIGSKVWDGIKNIGHGVGTVLRPVRKKILRFMTKIPGKIGQWAQVKLADIHNEEADEDFDDWVDAERNGNPQRVQRMPDGTVEVTI